VRRIAEAGGFVVVPSTAARRWAGAWWLYVALSVTFTALQFPGVACAIGGLAVWLSYAPLRAAVFLRGPRAIRRVAWDADGALAVATGERPELHAAELTLAAARFGADWIWLHVVTSMGRRAALIHRASVPAMGYVRLVWLLRFRHNGRGISPSC